jgi:hypothetical protein
MHPVTHSVVPLAEQDFTLHAAHNKTKTDRGAKQMFFRVIFLP